MKFSRNQSQKPECLRAVPDRCSAYQSLNRRKIVILHRNYIQKQNRAKSLPTTYLHNKVSFLLKSYFLSYEPHKNIQKTILITLFEPTAVVAMQFALKRTLLPAATIKVAFNLMVNYSSGEERKDAFRE